MGTTRREFVKWMTASGVALSLSRLASAEMPGLAARETLPGRQSWNPAVNGGGRIDGIAKVAGAKLYASDFRAADIPGWPTTTSHAMLVRAPDATHVYEGIELARLSGELKPSAVVTATDLARIGTRVPDFYAGDLFCPVGNTAVSWSAAGFVDIRALRRVRSGSTRAARWTFRAIRRGNRPGHNAGLRRLSFHPRGRADARRAGYFHSKPAGLAPDILRIRSARHGRLSPHRRAAPMQEPLPMASISARNWQQTIQASWCWTANSRLNL
jgi:hypothetical protein